MATLTTTNPNRTEVSVAELSGLRFDWLMAGMGLWLLGGLYLDGWAHTHNQAESFFTPWHGVLYTGFLVQAAVLAGVWVRNLRRGQAWREALPAGYGLSLVGAGIFTVGGVLDMIWHLVFGIEVSVEALLSPTHLMLAFGGILLVTGPLRAALARREAKSAWGDSLPMLISVIILFSFFTFFTDYASPFGGTYITNPDGPLASYSFQIQALGITQFLFQSALLAGIVLVLLRNNKLRLGHVTLLLTIDTALMVIMHERYMAVSPWYLFGVGVAGGLLGDVLFALLKPSLSNIRGLRLFAFGLPAGLYFFYIVTALVTVGLWWSIHLWTGAIVLSGAAGWLVSYLVIPSAVETVRVTPTE